MEAAEASWEIAPGPYEYRGPVSELDAADFWSLYRRYGAILFRDAVADPEAFADFSDRFGRDWVPYQLGGRETVLGNKKVQTVNTGLFGIPAHSELCHQPGRPQMAWFYCQRPANVDGQTTLYDGIAIAEQFPEELARAFEQRRLLYPKRMPLEQAQAYYDVGSAQELQALLVAKGWEQHFRIDGQCLLQSYEVPVFPLHPGSGKPVFANQIIHNSNFRPYFLKLRLAAERGGLAKVLFELVDRIVPYRQKTTIRGRGVAYSPLFEDRSIIPPEVVFAVARHVRQFQQAVEWNAGDVLVFDNTRYMHGRRKVADENRRILTRFGDMRL